MKRFTAILLTASLIISLASCGGSESASTTTSGTTTTTTATTEETTTPKTTTTGVTTTEATTALEETTTTPGSTTTTAAPETTTTTTAATTNPVTTTKVTTTTTKPVTTTKVTTTTTKPVTTTTPKTEPTTTTPAPTYDHCEGFNKIWGENGAPFEDTMNQYGGMFVGAGPFFIVESFLFEFKETSVFGIKLDSKAVIDFTSYSENENEGPYYCREATLRVKKTVDGEELTLESTKDILSGFYGPAEKVTDSDGATHYCWYNTADGDIDLYVRSNNYIAICFKEAGWKFTYPEGWSP